MSSAPAHDDVHGLVYSPTFLDALPVLKPRHAPHQPIRALSASQFSRVHLDYLTTHAPDSALFPFLHGIEGDNDAQTSFFAGSPQAHTVPRFRGLVWVACDEDPASPSSAASTPDIDADTDDDLDDDDDYSSTSSLESLTSPVEMMDMEVPMDVDPSDPSPDMPGCPSPEITAKAPPSALETSPVSPPPLLPHGHSRHAPHSPPAVLTSSFRPRDLLQLRGAEDGSVSYTFVEPRVPEGISLRNFGIQVPIFATLSDIVVYSPKGDTPAALALAEKFKDAIELKRAERCARYPESASHLVAYNVFVLEASPAEMAKTLPHLITRVDDVPAAHTDATDAHAEGEEHPKYVTEAEVRDSMVCANTVDFARREKEEMRDLTHASEVISIADSSVQDDPSFDPESLSGSTTASHWYPALGQVFLGNSNDVPMPPDRRIRVRRPSSYPPPFGEEEEEEEESSFEWRSNDPAHGLGYDICIECHDFAPFPTAAHVRAAEEHLSALERRWAERCLSDLRHVEDAEAEMMCVPPRPPPSASMVIHLPFPSSPPSTAGTLNALLPFIAFLEGLLQPPAPLTLAAARARFAPLPPSSPPAAGMSERRSSGSGPGFGPSSLPLQSAFPASFFPSSSPASANAYTRARSTSATFLPSSSTSYTSTSDSSASPRSAGSSSYGSSAATSQTSASVSALTGRAHEQERIPLRTRPVKILIYSADGYTESSVLALSLLMYLRRIALPEAYLTLQLEKRRSFFVYPADLPVLRKIEGRMERERERDKGGEGRSKGRGVVLVMEGVGESILKQSEVESPTEMSRDVESALEAQSQRDWSRPYTRPAAKSVSFAVPPAIHPAGIPAGLQPTRSHSLSDEEAIPPSILTSSAAGMGRPRASTLPAPLAVIPSMYDHQAWFNDPRFDGSFPSRVLPFLYLGNLNHASNAYMLHALGITHVVSVGECALVPPPILDTSASLPSCAFPGASANAQFIPGKGSGGQGSLFIEEREGRIKVLDIKGVCDDGIDTLEPQLEPICEWIDRARQEGGKVLVHCRVGVSRSATVTIAYVMKHLGLPLVDAYLIVRSRRLSVLIQPNMRLLYNLLGWEVKLARQRAGRNEDRLRVELARSLNWPYLAKEVHALNEKYLH